MTCVSMVSGRKKEEGRLTVTCIVSNSCDDMLFASEEGKVVGSRREKQAWW